jgi:hypothetical protein
MHTPLRQARLRFLVTLRAQAQFPRRQHRCRLATTGSLAVPVPHSFAASNPIVVAVSLPSEQHLRIVKHLRLNHALNRTRRVRCLVVRASVAMCWNSIP